MKSSRGKTDGSRGEIRLLWDLAGIMERKMYVIWRREVRS